MNYPPWISGNSRFSDSQSTWLLWVFLTAVQWVYMLTIEHYVCWGVGWHLWSRVNILSLVGYWPREVGCLVLLYSCKVLGTGLRITGSIWRAHSRAVELTSCEDCGTEEPWFMQQRNWLIQNTHFSLVKRGCVFFHTPAYLLVPTHLWTFFSR